MKNFWRRGISLEVKANSSLSLRNKGKHKDAKYKAIMCGFLHITTCYQEVKQSFCVISLRKTTQPVNLSSNTLLGHAKENTQTVFNVLI